MADGTPQLRSAVPYEEPTSEQWLAATTQSSPVALIGQDVTGKIVSWNRAATALLGFAGEDVVGRPVDSLVPAALREPLRSLERHVLRGEVIRDHETRRCTSVGDEVDMSVTLAPLRGADDSVIGIVTAASKTSHQRLLESSLRRRADRDALTGLYGRRRFDEELRRAIARSSRHGEHLAILVIDLDGLKACNDSRGHQTGDELLRSAAKALAHRTRASDVLARIGGDEFALIMPNTDGDQAEQVGNQLLSSLRTCKPDVDGPPIRVRASAGIAELIHQRSAPELLDAADGAMYQAKRDGGDRVARLQLNEGERHPQSPNSQGRWLGVVHGPVSAEVLLERLEEFDSSGGGSIGLIAWDLCVGEEQIADAWETLVCAGLIEPAGHDQDELLYRLTPAGWAAGEERATA